MGRNVTWLPSIETVNEKEWETFQVVDRPAPTFSLEEHSASWRETIFSPARSLLVPHDFILADSIENIEGLKLSGVVVSSGLKLAFLKKVSGKTLVVREGEYIASGFLLEGIGVNEIYIKSSESGVLTVVSLLRNKLNNQ